MKEEKKRCGNIDKVLLFRAQQADFTRNAPSTQPPRFSALPYSNIHILQSSSPLTPSPSLHHFIRSFSPTPYPSLCVWHCCLPNNQTSESFSFWQISSRLLAASRGLFSSNSHSFLQADRQMVC